MEKRRTPVVIKIESSPEAYVKACEILNNWSPDFIGIQNGFGFDFKRIVAHLAGIEWLDNKMEKIRLGKSGTGFF